MTELQMYHALEKENPNLHLAIFASCKRVPLVFRSAPREISETFHIETVKYFRSKVKIHIFTPE